ncbi:hypothetical protein ES288_A12G303200v1 [Gossypium darwinii]|uniref:Pentacotripeptide-repeat region of PRORP domain-containing protein n=1 Tax=Gossypium darwinii TaxID=34276 RepID=A0A5D2EGA7_GOSDA|nr:hypothetical protein ES288_A12G303200v1 [Gossypium darwinii]
MVSGYVQNGQVDEARETFEQMPQKNIVSWNAMIAGYVQCKRMDMARKLFDKMPFRDVTTWNTMITGEKALRLFVDMKRDGERLNRSSFASALSTCAHIAALELGMQLHGQLVKAGYESGSFVGNTLLLMYCKCGVIEEACSAFEEIMEKDIFSWNTMISGYAIHGFGKEALKIFESMKAAGFKPDDTTMVGLLSACCHAGLVDRGMEYFYSMNQDYGKTAILQHYNCMVDLLGRADRLDEVQKLIRNMPFEPDAATWRALLGASRIHGNTKLAEMAADMIFEMETENAGRCVLLSNLYPASGRWDDVSKARLKIRDTGVEIAPGCSWLEV